MRESERIQMIKDFVFQYDFLKPYRSHMKVFIVNDKPVIGFNTIHQKDIRKLKKVIKASGASHIEIYVSNKVIKK